MKRWLAAAVALAVLAVFAQDDPWVMYGSGVDGATYWVHKERIKKLNPEVFQLWTEHRQPTPTAVYANRPLPKFKRSLNLMTLDCSAMTIQPITTTYYDAAGLVVFTDSRPELPSPIVPGSVGETLSKIFCS